jgi:hypothetical protein
VISHHYEPPTHNRDHREPFTQNRDQHEPPTILRTEALTQQGSGRETMGNCWNTIPSRQPDRGQGAAIFIQQEVTYAAFSFTILGSATLLMDPGLAVAKSVDAIEG